MMSGKKVANFQTFAKEFAHLRAFCNMVLQCHSIRGKYEDKIHNTLHCPTMGFVRNCGKRFPQTNLGNISDIPNLHNLL